MKKLAAICLLSALLSGIASGFFRTGFSYADDRPEIPVLGFQQHQPISRMMAQVPGSLTTPASSGEAVVNSIPPTPQGLNIYINDQANLIESADQSVLQERLQALDEAGVAQISILVLPDTERDLSEFAPLIMNQWGIQHRNKKDGLLILVNAHRVKNNLSGNRIFVATGYALEEILPDALVGRILDEKALPAFENGDYSKGVTQTAITLSNILAGDKQLRASYAQPKEEPVNWIFIVIAAILFLSFFGRRNRFYGGGWGGGFGGGGGFSDGGGFGGGFGGGGDSGGGGGAGR